jgi:hypothetical protein
MNHFNNALTLRFASALRMKRESPKQWEPRDLVVTFLSGRSEKTSLHHETDRICRRHPTDLHKATRVRGQQAKRSVYFQMRACCSPDAKLVKPERSYVT